MSQENIELKAPNALFAELSKINEQINDATKYAQERSVELFQESHKDYGVPQEQKAKVTLVIQERAILWSELTNALATAQLTVAKIFVASGRPMGEATITVASNSPKEGEGK